MHEIGLILGEMAEKNAERGRLIKTLRDQRGLGQEDLARELTLRYGKRISTKSIGNWERGSGIHPDNLRNVADFFGRPVEEFQAHVEIPSPFRLKDEVNDMLEEFREAVAWIKERMAEQDLLREATAAEVRAQVTTATRQQAALLEEIANVLRSRELLERLDALHADLGVHSDEPDRRVRARGRRETDRQS